MAKNNNQPLLKNGSQGSDVKKLQQSLIDAGYDVGKTGADGIYGKNTTAAVRQYQQDNGLAVDGVAGPKTMGSLYTVKPVIPDLKDSGTPPTEEAPAPTPEAPAPPPEVPAEQAGASESTTSDIVDAANKALAAWQNNKPGAYQSQFRDEMDYYLGQYRDRDPFSYDFNQDGLYQMYKDQYMQMGQMAMMDTMGQAAAMTGGYGNSYAQTVGQQAYNQQLSQLNAIIPELYQMAYGRYRDEGQDLLNMYNIYADREAMDFNRYQANMENWWKQGDFLAGRADTAWEQNRLTGLDEYNMGQDAIRNEQWQSEFDREGQQTNREWLAGMIGNYGYTPTAEDLAAAGMTQAEADALKKAYDTAAASGSVDDNDDNPAEWDNGKLTTSQVKRLQKALGVTVDGKWGDDSFEAAGGLTADEAWRAYQRGELGTKPGGPDNPTGGLGDARKDAIYDWLEGVLTNPNLSSSFDPDKLINGSSFLTSDEERAYAREIISYLSTIR